MMIRDDSGRVKVRRARSKEQSRASFQVDARIRRHFPVIIKPDGTRPMNRIRDKPRFARLLSCLLFTVCFHETTMAYA